MDRQFPLTSKFQLNVLLKQWLNTSGSTIGDLHGKKSNPESLLWINIENKLYKIHADTNRKGIQEFLNNEKHSIITDQYDHHYRSICSRTSK